MTSMTACDVIVGFLKSFGLLPISGLFSRLQEANYWTWNSCRGFVFDSLSLTLPCLPTTQSPRIALTMSCPPRLVSSHGQTPAAGGAWDQYYSRDQNIGLTGSGTWVSPKSWKVIGTKWGNTGCGSWTRDLMRTWTGPSWGWVLRVFRGRVRPKLTWNKVMRTDMGPRTG